MDCLRSRGRLPSRQRRRPLHQPERDRRAGDAVLEWPAAGAGSVGRLGLLRAEPAPPPLRSGERCDHRQGGDPLAVGQDAGASAAGAQPPPHHPGADVTIPITTADAPSAAPPVRGGRHFDQRYLAPMLITCVLLAGQVTFGFLESWSRTFLAIATAISVELILVRALFRRWPHLASAYV